MTESAQLTGRVVRFVASHRIELEEVRLPELADGELLVRTRCSGISGGTEMLAYRGEIDPRLPLDETLGALGGTFAYPFAYGYSAVGVVERSRGRIREGSLVFAFHPHQDLFAIPERDVIPLDGASPRIAVLLPLVEAALQACLDAGTRLGEQVAIVGLGCVGILTGALLTRAGAKVLGSEPDPTRRVAAGAFGIESVPPNDLEEAIADRTHGRGATLVVEASGNPAALAEGLRLLGHEGTALVCSWYGRKPVPLPLGAEFHRRRLEIRSSQVSTIPSRLAGRWDRNRRRQAARSLLGELPLEALTTHEFPFERAPEAYAAVARREPGLIHAALGFA
jgi:2-desacetyl-2-hydroxyethyl bacteriochlorophyllide A dehydrogenase